PCCLADGRCLVAFVADCATANGTPQGAGSTCAIWNCPQPTTFPGHVPDGSASRPGTPLTVVKAAVAGDITITWGATCSADATDYEIEEGVIGAWYSHVAARCSTGLVPRVATLTPASASRYYLVVPVTATAEGSYGVDSRGTERPRRP